MAEVSKHATMLHHIHVLVIGSLMDAPDFFLFPAQTTAAHSKFLFIPGPNHSSPIIFISFAPAQLLIRPPA
jgi:hypothetical protein